MTACKALLVRISHPSTSAPFLFSPFFFTLFSSVKPPLLSKTRCYSGISCGAVALETVDGTEPAPQNPILVGLPEEDSCEDTVEELLTKKGNPHDDDVSRFMKMERKPPETQLLEGGGGRRWFPYLDRFKAANGVHLSSVEVLEALDPLIMAARKQRFRNAVKNRSYSVSLVIDGLCDYGNVSAAFRSADALGLQSVHVVSCDSSKRYRDNRVSMGAEKWLDIELWDSTQECFKILNSHGYRIATTHVGIDAVSVYDMDWSYPTAIVVGNENRGISEEALELSDLHCSIPMKGMVDSFNVSVAAGILMHQAVCDRTSRLVVIACATSLELPWGSDVRREPNFPCGVFLRHSQSAISIANEYAKRKLERPVSKL